MVKPANALRRSSLLVLLAHRRPHVGVERVGARGRLHGIRRHLDVAAEPGHAGQVVGVGLVPLGRRRAEPDAGHRRGQRQRPPHVVGVADVGHGAALHVPEHLAQRQQVGQGLAGMGPVRQQVHHRHRRREPPSSSSRRPGRRRVEGARHAHQRGVVEHPRAQHGVVAGQGPGHVLGRLALVDADLGALDVDGMAAERPPRRARSSCGCGPRASRTPAPHPGRPAPGAPRPRGATAVASTSSSSSHDRSSTSRKCRVMTPRSLDAWRPRRPARRPAGARPSSISSSLTNSDGASRMVSGRGAFTTSPRPTPPPPPPWPARGRAPHRAGARRPAPRRPRRAPRARPAAAPRPDAARAGTSSASMTASVARAAAAASGWPPKVLPWSPGEKRRRHLGPGPARADGHAVAERLGHGHDVGLDAGVLEGEPPARAARARSGSRPP